MGYGVVRECDTECVMRDARKDDVNKVKDNGSRHSPKIVVSASTNRSTSSRVLYT